MAPLSLGPRREFPSVKHITVLHTHISVCGAVCVCACVGRCLCVVCVCVSVSVRGMMCVPSRKVRKAYCITLMIIAQSNGSEKCFSDEALNSKDYCIG